MAGSTYCSRDVAFHVAVALVTAQPIRARTASANEVNAPICSHAFCAQQESGNPNGCGVQACCIDCNTNPAMPHTRATAASEIPHAFQATTLRNSGGPS